MPFSHIAPRPNPFFLFAIGIENSYPTINGGRTRVDQMKATGHYPPSPIKWCINRRSCSLRETVRQRLCAAVARTMVRRR